MSASRAAFFSNIGSLRATLGETYFQDWDPSTNKDVPTAQMLRNGLSIILFNHLEEYITTTARRSLERISQSAIGYDDFPDKLREALTIRALRGIQNEYEYDKLNDKSTKIVRVESRILELAGFKGETRSFSGYGFNNTGANLYADDIKDYFSFFGVEDGWGKMNKLASALGVGRPSLKDDFLSYANVRHSAAHKAESNIPIGDLAQMLDGVCTIGIIFEILSKFLTDTLALSRDSMEFEDLRQSAEFSCGDISYGEEIYKERRISVTNYDLDVQTRVFKNYATLEDAVDGTLARRNISVAVFRDQRGIPVRLFSG